MTQSVRAQIVERRTYLRPLNSSGTVFETRAEAWRRVINHQQWLWERAKHAPLNDAELAELEEFYGLAMESKITVSGRTRWLGGTEVARTRESSMFNCSFVEVQTVHDVVDTVWLLLQGCGVGFSASVGVLNGFTKKIPELEVIRSKKVLPRDEQGNPISDPSLKGNPNNVEYFNRETGVWTIRLGDSAEAWAKFFGKLLAGKLVATKLVLDFSEIRPAGYRLSGYGWISSGDEKISKAVVGIFEVMNKAAGKLLTAIDILDIENHLGMILASRRSAEIALYDMSGPEWEEFAAAKTDYYHHWVVADAKVIDTEHPKSSRTVKIGEHFAVWDEKDGLSQIGPTEWVPSSALRKSFEHRGMSNNSLVFYDKPTRRMLKKIFAMMKTSGGSEPGFFNGAEALRRASYFRGTNPCGEILLGDGAFCNLVETNISRFNGDEEGLHRAHRLVARANYRQTCVNLDDGILQRTWHELNEFLRLCGVGVTGVIGWEYVNDAEAWQELRKVAHDGANGMADELDLPRPKLITTIKPSGTQSKVAGLEGDEIGEGIHKPLGRYILNTIEFSADDPLVRVLTEANYKVMPSPRDREARLITLPVEYNNIAFEKATMILDGKEVEVEVNLESAVSQLERYKLVMENYVDHNCSVTVSYSDEEVPDIIDWFMDNWDVFIGVSFLYRNDPTKTAADLGHPYLPQAVVDEATFRTYVDSLRPVDLTGTDIEAMMNDPECATGACPIR